MARDEEDEESDGPPWHTTHAATFVAGGVGAVLLAALAVSVVQMSDDWSQPQTTLLTTPATTQPAPTSRDAEPFVITPSTTPTTFATSVLSTTEFIDPAATLPPTETTSGSTTTPESTTSQTDSAHTELPTTYPLTPGEATTHGATPDETTSPTRRTPRYNITRTLAPG